MAARSSNSKITILCSQLKARNARIDFILMNCRVKIVRLVII